MIVCTWWALFGMTSFRYDSLIHGINSGSKVRVAPRDERGIKCPSVRHSMLSFFKDIQRKA